MGEAPRIDPFVVVHQAVGMVMEYRDCSDREALEKLVALARENNRPTPDIAADVVERRLRLV